MFCARVLYNNSIEREGSMNNTMDDLAGALIVTLLFIALMAI